MSDEATKEATLQADGESLSRLLKEAVVAHLKERNYDESNKEHVARAYSRTLVESILVLSSFGIHSDALKTVCEHAIGRGSEMFKSFSASNSRGGSA